MELSFCIVELSEGSPSRMRNRNLILCKEFAFFFFGTDHQDGNFQTEFPCSCRGWNWNFFSQWCSCGSGISHSVCRLRGAAWRWLRLACHGFPFSKLKSSSLDKSKRGCPHILLYLSRVPLAPTSLKTILLKSCFFFFFQIWKTVFKVCLRFKLSFLKNEISTCEGRWRAVLKMALCFLERKILDCDGKAGSSSQWKKNGMGVIWLTPSLFLLF